MDSSLGTPPPGSCPPFHTDAEELMDFENLFTSPEILNSAPQLYDNLNEYLYINEAMGMEYVPFQNVRYEEPKKPVCFIYVNSEGQGVCVENLENSRDGIDVIVEEGVQRADGLDTGNLYSPQTLNGNIMEPVQNQNPYEMQLHSATTSVENKQVSFSSAINPIPTTEVDPMIQQNVNVTPIITTLNGGTTDDIETHPSSPKPKQNPAKLTDDDSSSSSDSDSDTDSDEYVNNSESSSDSDSSVNVDQGGSESHSDYDQNSVQMDSDTESQSTDDEEENPTPPINSFSHGSLVWAPSVINPSVDELGMVVFPGQMIQPYDNDPFEFQLPLAEENHVAYTRGNVLPVFYICHKGIWRWIKVQKLLAV